MTVAYLKNKKEATRPEKSSCLNKTVGIILTVMSIIVSWPAAQRHCWRGHHLWTFRQYLIYFPLSGIVDKYVRYVNSNTIFLSLL